MEQSALFSLLPHRPPMLLLDFAQPSENGEASGGYTVRGDEWFLQGHFPGNPVVPGVILCEMMAQTCCVLLAGSAENTTPYFTGLDGVRFRQKVVPGDRLTFTCRITRRKGPFVFAEGRGAILTENAEKEAVSGAFSFALAPNTP